MCYKKILCGSLLAAICSFAISSESSAAAQREKTIALKAESKVKATLLLNFAGEAESQRLQLADEAGNVYKKFSAQNTWIVPNRTTRRAYKISLTSATNWKLKKEGTPGEVGFSCVVGSGSDGKQNETAYSADAVNKSVELAKNDKLGFSIVPAVGILEEGTWTAELTLDIKCND